MQVRNEWQGLGKRDNGDVTECSNGQHPPQQLPGENSMLSRTHDAIQGRSRDGAFGNLAGELAESRGRSNCWRNREDAGYDCEITAGSRIIDIRERRTRYVH